MDIILRTFILFVGIDSAFSVTCLSCRGVLQPRYCTNVRQCPQHSTCGVQKYLTISGETRYDVDCVSDEECHFKSNHTSPTTSKPTTTVAVGVVVGKRISDDSVDDKRQVPASINLECSECCKGDLCNAQGCGISGYPNERGVICYGCQQESDPIKCEKLAFCRKDEMCGLYKEEIFGDSFYSSRCVPKYECDIVGHSHPSPFGKRQAGAFRESICGQCCSTDLCNHQCGGIHTTATKTSKITHTTRSTSTTSVPSTSTSTTMATTSPNKITDKNERQYIVMFKSQYSTYNGALEILFASETSNTVYVTLPTGQDTFTMGSGIYVRNVSTSLRGSGDEKDNKAIFVNATDPISVFGLNQWVGSTDGYMAIPIEGLGKEYKLVTLEPTQANSNFMVAAVENNTRVNININSNSRLHYKGTYYDSSNNLTVTLNRLQTLHITHPHDLTGTRIVSDKPIAVLSGDECSHVMTTYDNCADMTEYLPPVIHWGVEFIVPKLENTTHYTLKIISAEGGAKIDTYDKTGRHDTYTLSGDVKALNITMSAGLPLFIRSNSPIMVAVFPAGSSSEHHMGSMFLVPSISHFKTEYNIAIPNGFDSRIVIIVQTKDVDGIRIDGKGIRTDVNFSTVSNSYGNFKVYTPLNGHFTSKRYVHITHTRNVPFGVLVYGVAQRIYSRHPQMFSYPGGMYFPSLSI